MHQPMQSAYSSYGTRTPPRPPRPPPYNSAVSAVPQDQYRPLSAATISAPRLPLPVSSALGSREWAPVEQRLRADACRGEWARIDRQLYLEADCDGVENRGIGYANQRVVPSAQARDEHPIIALSFNRKEWSKDPFYAWREHTQPSVGGACADETRQGPLNSATSVRGSGGDAGANTKIPQTRAAPLIQAGLDGPGTTQDSTKNPTLGVLGWLQTFGGRTSSATEAAGVEAPTEVPSTVPEAVSSKIDNGQTTRNRNERAAATALPKPNDLGKRGKPSKGSGGSQGRMDTPTETAAGADSRSASKVSASNKGSSQMVAAADVLLGDAQEVRAEQTNRRAAAPSRADAVGSAEDVAGPSSSGGRADAAGDNRKKSLGAKDRKTTKEKKEKKVRDKGGCC